MNPTEIIEGYKYLDSGSLLSLKYAKSIIHILSSKRFEFCISLQLVERARKHFHQVQRKRNPELGLRDLAAP